jgi:hypothetical protein
MKARKKPVVIDFFSINNDTPLHSIERWVEKFGDNFSENFTVDYNDTFIHLKVKTLEGTSYDVTPEDVIIRGIKGEYYPCKKDVFEQTYEVVE